MVQTRFPKVNSFAGAWDWGVTPSDAFDAPEAQAHQTAKTQPTVSTPVARARQS
jgi:hypothetical protein